MCPPIALLTSAAPPDGARHPVSFPLPPALDGTRCSSSVPVGCSGVPGGGGQRRLVASPLSSCAVRPPGSTQLALPSSPSQVVKGEMGNRVVPQTQSFCRRLPKDMASCGPAVGTTHTGSALCCRARKNGQQPCNAAQQEARGPGFSIPTRILHPNRINMGTDKPTSRNILQDNWSRAFKHCNIRKNQKLYNINSRKSVPGKKIRR